MNYPKFILVTFIFLNIYLLYIFRTPIFDQIINLMITYGVFNFYNENNFNEDDNISRLQIFISIFLLICIFYRSLWLHSGDNFIYLLFTLLLIILLMLTKNIKNILSNIESIKIALIFPLTKILFIPLAVIINPFSTLFTWLSLNAFGFNSIINGQEIFYNNSGINVTFSCSGAGQIIFCFSGMIILNFYLPLKNRRLLLIQLCRAFLFTFFANILRLFLLTIYVHTANSDGFSIFDYLHGGNGGLFFSFFSMLISCESYKRLYIRGLRI